MPGNVNLARVERVPDHPVPAGPLAVRWLGYELPLVRAGAPARARISFENAGTVHWIPFGQGRVCIGYHWLDEFGNAVVWDGLWTALPHPLAPGERADAVANLRGPIPPGRYRLVFDLVADDRAWFADAGNATLEQEVVVASRLAERTIAVVGADERALRSQAERLVGPDDAAAVAYLAPGCIPSPDWATRVLDAHAEGYAAVGGSIAAGGALRRRPPELEPWAPGPGRVPGFAHPLLCPSLVRDLEPAWLEPIAGLPALSPPAEEPWLYDGRIQLTARVRRA
jgi:hypothetical protein